MSGNTASDDIAPDELNRRAMVGLVLSVVVAVGGLFALPVIQSVSGLAFRPAFGVVLAIELVGFLGVTVSVLRLHRERSYE